MKCLICESETEEMCSMQILKKYDIKYYRCKKCGCVFTEKPFWLGEAYSGEQGISDLDTGVMARNLNVAQIVNVLLENQLRHCRVGVDLSGGYGIFCRMMRDLGHDYYWTDIYTENLLARGFEFTGTHADLGTAFEVAEHLDSPMETFSKWLDTVENLVMSTVLIGNGPAGGY